MPARSFTYIAKGRHGLYSCIWNMAKEKFLIPIPAKRKTSHSSLLADASVSENDSAKANMGNAIRDMRSTIQCWQRCSWSDGFGCLNRPEKSCSELIEGTLGLTVSRGIERRLVCFRYLGRDGNVEAAGGPV
jgi:hypothetical protein